MSAGSRGLLGRLGIGVLFTGVERVDLTNDNNLLLTIHARSEATARTIAKNYVRVNWKVVRVDIVAMEQVDDLGKVQRYELELNI